jgi:aryl-alcohol dehydrogenase-like predicted oxidoreductase
MNIRMTTNNLTLPIRHLPGTDLRVSALCQGAVPFGMSVTGEEGDRLFGAFLDAGGNFFDTAHCYCCWLEGGDGVSERTLGEMVRRFGVRDRVVIATKGGHPDIPPVYVGREHYLSPEVVGRDLDGSLQRLGMDHVDLYYLHRDDARAPVGEVIDMLNAEIDRGKIRYLGCSNWPVARIAAANAYAAEHGLQGFAVSQPQFSLAKFNFEPGEDPTLRSLTGDDIAWHTETGLPAIAFSSTACGYFAGSTRENAVAQFDNPVSQSRRARARQLAAELGCTPHQAAIAYLTNQKFITIPILGTASVEHLREAVGATSIKLTEEQVKWLRG